MDRIIKLPPDVAPYARKAHSSRSSMMTEGPHNLILQQAADGLEVDIHDLNLACMAALASCATRGSTSSDRRLLAADIMYLAEYVAAALAGRAHHAAKPRLPVEFAPHELQEWLASS